MECTFVQGGRCDPTLLLFPNGSPNKPALFTTPFSCYRVAHSGILMPLAKHPPCGFLVLKSLLGHTLLSQDPLLTQDPQLTGWPMARGVLAGRCVLALVRRPLPQVPSQGLSWPIGNLGTLTLLIWHHGKLGTSLPPPIKVTLFI